MKQDKFLTGILIGIGVLVVAAVALFFVRQSSLDYVNDDTPEGVIHNYLLALNRENYEKAYSYLADKEDKPSFAHFRQTISTDYAYRSDIGVKILDTDTYKGEGSDEAVVQLSISYASSDPIFRSGYSSNNSATLEKQNGEWKITMMPYDFWGWDWYNADEF